METLDTDTEDGPAVAAPKSGPARLASPLAILTIAVAVLVLAALGVSVFEWQNNADRANNLAHINSLRASALSAAEGYSIDVGSYDYTDLHGPNAAWTQIESHSTPKFSQSYKTTSAALEQTILSYKASAKATVSQAAVSSVSGNGAVVIVLLSQSITNNTQKSGPQTQQYLVTMTLVRQQGHWLIDNVQASV
jgi:hypothetical protein